MAASKKRRKGRFEHAKEVFRQHGGMMRTGEATAAGIHPGTLYGMRDLGEIECLARGLYRLAEAPPLGNVDLVTVALRVPDAVICLISALAFHEITTQVPHAVHVALASGAREPRLRHPSLEIFEFGGQAFAAGIETHELDGVPVRIYSPEKTLADCFKYRNKIGVDVAVEALRLYAERGDVKVNEIMRFARICRVATVMRPYLEATF